MDRIPSVCEVEGGERSAQVLDCVTEGGQGSSHFKGQGGRSKFWGMMSLFGGDGL